MSDKNRSNTTGGAIFPSLLQVAFIVLKLCKVIDWSWWWVFVPTWGTTILVFIGIAIFFLVVYLKEREK